MAEKLGPYRIVSELGRGGMGVVLKGYDDALERPVAIKVLGDHVAGDASYVARFIREAQNAAKLNHPNIVQIFFIGEDSGRHFFVMEFVEGRSLQQILRAEGRMDPLRASELIRQSAAGLAAAHDRGVIHRDIKPANIILCNNGVVKIADFGLAFMPEGGAKLTATGNILGTPGYLSPEQCMAEPLDKRTDIYSLGISFYELLSGAIPFKADSPFALVHQVVTSVPPDVSTVNPLVGAELAGVLRKMIAKKREDRFADCHELIADLDAYLGRHGYPVHVGGRQTPVPVPVAVAGVDPVPSFELPDGEGNSRTMNLGTREPVGKDATIAAPAGKSAASAPTLRAAPALVHPGSTALQTQPNREVVPAAVVAEPVAPPRRSMAPVFLAAGLVLLLLLGAGAFAAIQFVKRDPLKLFAKKGDESTRAAQAAGAAPANDDLATGGAAVLPLAAASSDPAMPADAATAGDRLPSASDTGAAPDSAAAQPADGAAAVVEAPDPPPAARSAAVAGAAGPAAGKVAPVGSGQVRSAEPPARADAAPLPATPRVIVFATGERLLADSIEKQLQQALREQSYEVVELSNNPDIDDVLARGGDPLGAGAMASALRANKIHVVVMARCESLGERELNYMNRRESAAISRLRVNAFIAAERAALGDGFSEKLEYTPLTVDRKVEAAVQSLSTDLGQAIRSGWAGYRERSGR